MAQKERFFQGIVDYTPYWAWAPVLLITTAFLFGGGYALWKLGGVVKKITIFTSSPTTAIEDSAKKAANDLADQAKEKAQAVVEDQKKAATDQAKQTVQDEIKNQVTNLKNSISVPTQ